MSQPDLESIVKRAAESRKISGADAVVCIDALCDAVQELAKERDALLLERDEARALVLRRLQGSDALTLEDAEQARARWDAEKGGGV